MILFFVSFVYFVVHLLLFRGYSPDGIDSEQVAVPAAPDDLRARGRERLAGALEVAGRGGAADDQRGRAGRADRGGRGAGPARDPGRRLRDGPERARSAVRSSWSSRTARAWRWWTCSCTSRSARRRAGASSSNRPPRRRPTSSAAPTSTPSRPTSPARWRRRRTRGRGARARRRRRSSTSSPAACSSSP